MGSFIKSAVTVAALSLVPMTVSAASFTLDFGDVSADNFSTTGVIEYSNVASGINATLTAADTFTSTNKSNNGSVNGDIRVNALNSQTIELTLTLFDAAIGDGFSTVYDPGTDFDWALGFYDIDGWDDQPNTYYDVVTIHAAEDGAMSYTVTDTTGLVITEDSGENTVTFSGETTEGIAGQTGLSGTLTQEQSDVSMILNLTNLSTVSFDYTVVGFDNRGRNLLVDGGSITLAGNTTTTVVNAVPLPASGALMLGAIAAAGLARRTRRG